MRISDWSSDVCSSDLDPYDLRKRGLDERLEPHEIGRALFHLNQRRGFKSNRKAERKSGDDKESGKIATGAKALDIAMEEDGARNYGEFLAGRKTQRVRMPLGGAGYDFYPERSPLESEFDCFWAAHTQHHAPLLIEPPPDTLTPTPFF